MTARTTKAAVLALAVIFGACASAKPIPTAPKPPVSVAPPRSVASTAVVDTTYYRPVAAPVRVTLRPVDLPLTDAALTRTDRADDRWNAAPEAVRDRVRKSGFAVLRGDGKRMRLGEYYAGLRDARVPFVVTMDAMVQIAHMAIDRLLADAEERTIAPGLWVTLARLDTRLEAEATKATSDLVPAYAVARGIVAVARGLAEPGYTPPSDLAPSVKQEMRRVIAHVGPAESPLLGIMLDYADMAPRGALAAGDRWLGNYRALAWLAQAPLMIASRAEIQGAPLDVARARAHTRAALLIARLVQADIDAQGALAWDRVAKPIALVDGPPDDPSPRDLAQIALKAGLDVHDAATIQNVVRVDRTRHATIADRLPRAYDGAGGVKIRGNDASLAFTRASLGMRIFGPAATPDSEVLQALVFPAVSGRAMPTGLDVAAWLGASEARTIAHEIGAEKGYDAHLDALVQGRPLEEARHESVIASGLDALGTYLAPSRADGAIAGATTAAWQRRKIEVTLGSWATLRHDALALTRVPPTPTSPAPPGPHVHVAAFVEPHPEAIAELVATVEQLARGLVAMGAIAAPPTPTSVAGGALAMLRTCLSAALHEANDEPISAEDAANLADLPARLVDLEARLAPVRGADRPVVVDVHTDLGKHRVLEEGIGAIDDLYVVLREPRAGRLVLAVGAAIAHHEIVQPATLRMTDDQWRARLFADPPPRAAWTDAYLVADGAIKPK